MMPDGKSCFISQANMGLLRFHCKICYCAGVVQHSDKLQPPRSLEIGGNILWDKQFICIRTFSKMVQKLQKLPVSSPFRLDQRVQTTLREAMGN